MGIPRIQEAGIVLLGSPVGEDNFVHDVIERKIQAVHDITQLLPTLQDPHSEFVLLRSCFSLPKTMFLLRSTNPLPHQDLWTSFDDLIRDTLTHILGSGISDTQWSQAQLPVAMGGLGLRSAAEHSVGAYISSVQSAETLKEGLLTHRNSSTDLSSAIAFLSRQLQEEVTSDELYGLSQKMISYRIDVKLELSLANSLLTQRDKTRLISLSLPHAGDWINVIPSATLGLHVRPQEFRYSVLYRLGAPVYPSSGPCPACQKPSDRFGDHAIVCGSHGERIARHHHLRDALYQAAVSANLAPRKEEQALLPGTNARPADVFIPKWTHGRDTALDVTVVSPLLDDRVVQSGTTPGHTLNLAFNEKCRAYHQACESAGVTFLPLPVETLGGWHAAAVDQIRKLARAGARNMGKEEDEAVKHLFQKLSVLLVKGNADLLLNRIPASSMMTTVGEY